MELGKIAAALLALLSIAVAVFQVYSFVASVISGQMVINGPGEWIMLFVYHLGLPAYLSLLAFYFAYPERMSIMGANALTFALVSGMIVLMIAAFIGGFSLSVMMWSVFYALIIGWVMKFLVPAINLGKLVAWIFFFFVAEFFYILGWKVLLSDYVLGNLKATISDEMSEAKSMFGRVVAFLVAASLVTSFAKAVVTLLFFALSFGNIAQPDFVNSLPTAVVAFIFTVVPVTAASIILSRIYNAVKDWLSKHFIRA